MLIRYILLPLAVGASWQYYLLTQQATAQKIIPSDTLITLERIPNSLFGGPDYKLTIEADGTVVYVGMNRRQDSKLENRIKGSISREKLSQLISEFEKINYFSLKERYERREDGCSFEWTDQPYAITSIKMNGRSKSITHYHGCMKGYNFVYPEELTVLENKIDDIVETQQWQK